MTIPVLEIFGPTVQGEGLLVGQKTMFVRTAGCDYRCFWCDSAFTWDGSAKDDIRQLTADAVIKELDRLAKGRYGHVTISGGNPALLEGMGELVQLLGERGVRTAVETQGSRWQDWLLDIDDVTLSPKPPSSEMGTNFTRLDEIVGKLWNRSARKGLCLKVVVFNEDDMQYAIEVHERYPEIPFVMQTGNEDVHSGDDEELVQKLLRQYEWLIDKVALEPRLNQIRVLPQLHTLVWGNKRGV